MRTRRHPVQRLVCLVVLPALFALAAPAGAHAVWGAPVTLSPPGGDAGGSQVAVDPNGNAVFVWSRYDDTTDCGGSACVRIQARARTATGALSAVQTLSPSGKHAFSPHVGVDRSGKAVFVWARNGPRTTCGTFGTAPCNLVEARARSAAGSLTPTQALSDPALDAGQPHVAVNSGGNAVFAWQLSRDGTTDCGGSPCSRIQARARSAAGALSATQNVSPRGRDVDFDHDVAVDPNGNAVFVWLLYDESLSCDELGCFRVQARARSAAGSLSPIQGLSPYASGYEADHPQVAFDPNGNAVFAWQLWDITTGFASGSRIQARVRSSSGALSGAPMLSAPGFAHNPQLAVDRNGNAVFVWQRTDETNDCFEATSCFRIQTRARSAAGALSAIQTLSDAGQDAQVPEVAVDQSGNAVVVWQRPDGTAQCDPDPPWLPGCVRIQARARSAAGALGAVATLSAPGQNAESPEVAVDPDGDAVAVWRRFGGANWRIQAATGP